MPASRKANACIEEVEDEFATFENYHNRGAHEDAANEAARTRQQEAAEAFKALADEIDEALSGGDHASRIIRRGEQFSEHLHPRGVRHYKIPLPSRPTEVAVTIIRNSGRLPGLWGSTSFDKPCSSQYEIKGHDSKLVYRHMVHPTNNEEDGGVDRRRAVPSCRDLFVTLEAEMGECHVDLLVTFSHINVVLTRSELAAQLAKSSCKSWATTVSELQREPMARAEFETHVIDLRKAKYRKQMEFSRGLHYVRSNITAVCEGNAREKKLLVTHKRALQNIARHDAASVRRLELSASLRNSKSDWVEEPNRHLQRCNPAVVTGKCLAVESEPVPALPST